MNPPNCRIAMYSHDGMVLGHVRRNLVIAQALGEAIARWGGQVSTLLISGAYESGAFELPVGVDCLTLPALKKDAGGSYQPRRLPIGTAGVASVRSGALRGAMEAFDPDVVIVDKLARGIERELDPALDVLRRRGRTRFVLGLRDVLDQPSVVAAEWARDATHAAMRDIYDAIWVYGSPTVYDSAREYDLPPDIVAKVRYTGYFDIAAAAERLGGGDGCAGDPLAALNLPDAPFTLCMVGGGEDGGALAEAFARSTMPAGTNAVLVTGPFMLDPIRRRLRQEAANRPWLRVIDFCSNPHALLRKADRVVAMGGYNTVWEVLSHGKPALIAPRVSPRQEQMIRAVRLRELGLLDVLCPDEVTPSTISQWLSLPPPVRPCPRDVVEMDGLERLPGMLAEVLSIPRRRSAGDSAALASAAGAEVWPNGVCARVG